MATSSGADGFEEMNVFACSFCAPPIDDNIAEKLKSVLPPGVKYIIDSCDDSEHGLEALMHANLQTEEQALGWLKCYENLSLITLRVKKTFPSKGFGAKNLFKKLYRCQHNSRHSGKKNTDCPVEVLLTLKRTGTGKKHQTQSKDPHMPDYPLRILIRGKHNHSVSSAAALRYRDVDESVCQKFKDLFVSGYSPSSAYLLHQFDLQNDFDTQYCIVGGDRRWNPDKAWCYRLYYQLFHKAYGPVEVQFPAIKQHVETLNTEMQSIVASLNCQESTDENFIAITQSNEAIVVAICTPLMKRVHRMIRHSSEMVFFDSGGHMDRENTRVFLLLTHSAAGGLPIGVLLLSNEQYETISCALWLYLSLLDGECFGGRGKKGPELFMTDDSTAERKALQEVFPDSTSLCSFHILKAFWRFLWNSKSGVKMENRQQLFRILKDMLYAPSENELETIFKNAISNCVVKQHPKVLSHLESLYKRRPEWALCCRSKLPIRGNNTNNFCDGAMHIMKDEVLQRTKVFNIQQLIDFVVTRLDAHYKFRLISVANNRLDANRGSRFMSSDTAIDLWSICQLQEDTYEVPSEHTPGLKYTVNMAIGCCSCPVGNTGGPCKHQAVVMKAFQISSWNFLPVVDPEIRRLFHIVATGNTDIPRTWFDSPTSMSDVVHSCDMEVTDSSQSEVASTAMKVHEEACVQLPDPALVDKLAEFHNRLKNLYYSDPVTFGPAIESCCNQALKSSDSSIALALFCFGKNKEKTSAQRGVLCLGKAIGVRPMALSRRRTSVVGRKLCHLGQPSQSSRSQEHAYAKRCASGHHCHLMPKRRRCAPRCLEEAVSHLEPLGRSHNKK